MEILWGVVAGLFNGVGALFVFGKNKFSNNELNRYLNLAAGIMLAASFFSLLEPAHTTILSAVNAKTSALIFGGGLIVGYLFLGLLNYVVPHLHHVSGDNKRHIILFVLAVALHKVPEGLAMGIAFANGDNTGEALSLGIMLQNIPEGLSVALSMVSVGFSRTRAVAVAALTGLMQPIGMLIGLPLGMFGPLFVSFWMTVAGSALMFVVINEVLPQSYCTHEDIKNSGALFLGFLLMGVISILL